MQEIIPFRLIEHQFEPIVNSTKTRHRFNPGRNTEASGAETGNFRAAMKGERNVHPVIHQSNRYRVQCGPRPLSDRTRHPFVANRIAKGHWLARGRRLHPSQSARRWFLGWSEVIVPTEKHGLAARSSGHFYVNKRRFDPCVGRMTHMNKSHGGGTPHLNICK
jgi:hypothetical protein